MEKEKKREKKKKEKKKLGENIKMGLDVFDIASSNGSLIPRYVTKFLKLF